MLSADEVIKKYLGSGYRFKGREGSIDCYGLVLSVYMDIGITLPDLRIDDDEKWHSKGKSLDLCSLPDLFEAVIVPLTFDLVAFFNPKGIVNHAGIYVGSGNFLHATKTAGVCVQRFYDRQWQSRLAGIYRHKTRVVHDQD